MNMEAKRNKRKCEAAIKRYEYSIDPEEVKHLTEAKEKLGNLLLREEIYWKQRAKQFWLREGDKNTRFFHSMASARKKVKNISKLKRDD